jgi:hypothetical protein
MVRKLVEHEVVHRTEILQTKRMDIRVRSLLGWLPDHTEAKISGIVVLDPGKGVCADPVGKDTTLGVVGPGPPVGAGERQLSLNRGGEKT